MLYTQEDFLFGALWDRPVPSNLVVKKLAVKLSFKHSLTVFSRMDEAGSATKDLFPLWVRGPVTLKMRDPKKHRQLQMHSNACLFVSEGPEDVTEETHVAAEVLEKVVKKFGISTLQRVGVQQFLIAEDDRSFEELKDLLCAKLFCPTNRISGVEEFSIKDMAYTLELQKDDWVRSVSIGPMTKDEWFDRFDPPSDVFEATLEGSNIFKFRDSFPDVFVFVDIDTFSKKIPRHGAVAGIERESERSRNLAEKLISYIRE